MTKTFLLRAIKPVLILLVCFVWSNQALAHDPGLSTAELKLNQSGLTAELAMAPSDVQTICGIDGNGDSQISKAEFEEAKRCLSKSVIDGFELWGDNKRMSVVKNEATYDVATSVINVRLTFSGRATTHLHLRSELIHLMPRGHKQFVTLKHDEGRILVERMLAVNDDQLSYEFSEQAGTKGTFSGFLVLGIEHILTGYDHLAFLLALLLATNSFWSVGKVISSFTIAHSLTLALATFGLVQIPSRVVEPLIAASIVYVAVENLRCKQHHNQWLLTFGFGLVHGLGFASVLRDLGIGQSASAALGPLLSFNLGVEFGQLAVAALVLPVIWRLKKRPQFDLRYVPACSAALAVVGCYWLIQRAVM